MDIDVLIEQFRTLYKLTEAEVDDTTLTAYIDKAVRKISQYYPDINVGFVLTVANQGLYEIDEDNLLKIKEVFYNPESEADEVIEDPTSVGLNSTYSLTSQLEFIERMKMQRMLRPYDAEIKSVNKFTLIPTPLESGQKIYYEFEKYRTISDIPDLFEEDVINLVFYYRSEIKLKEMMNDPNATKYNFDRKGNIIADKSNTIDAAQRVHKSNLEDIIKNIKEKVRML